MYGFFFSSIFPLMKIAVMIIIVCIVFCIFCSWLETNTPYYYSECVRVLGPVTEQGLEKAKSAAVFISENTSRFIVWVKETTPLVIEWVRPWLQLHLTLNI